MKNRSTRRDFLKAGIFTATTAGFFCDSISHAAEPVWHFSAEEAFKAASFNPQNEGCEYFVAVADTHRPEYYQCLPDIVREWNALEPSPAFAVCLGDMICSASRSFGHVPDAKGLDRARGEYALFTDEIKTLKKDIPFYPVIGNHDTYPGEKDAALFREAFPGVKPYGAFERKGVHYLRWNGGHSAHPDREQIDWMKRYLETISLKETVVVFVHQPSVGGVVGERGVSTAVRELFEDFDGELWLFGGHGHSNRTQVFRLPKTTIVQCMISGQKTEGYWICGIRDGRIIVRICRELGKGYRVDNMPNRSKAGLIPVPFEGRDDLLWSMLIGEEAEDESAFVSNDRGGNCIYFWFYVGELIYKLPLDKVKNQATRFAVLANFRPHRKTGEAIKIFASGDNEHWIETPIQETKNSVNTFSIPELMRSGPALYVKLAGFGYGTDTSVGGFALCR